MFKGNFIQGAFAFLIVAVLWLMPQLAVSQEISITLKPVADTYIYYKTPTTNYGNAPYFWVHENTYKRILIKFNLSSIPRTAKIVKAKLKLYADQHTSYNETIDPLITPLLKPWTENGATWNTTDGTTPWNHPGASGDDLEFWTFAFLDSPIEYYEVNEWHAADITSLVQYWVDGSITNNGARINDITTGSGTSHRFVSKEGTEGFRPKLEITYIDNGVLSVPDTYLNPEIIERADSYIFQHLDADRTQTLDLLEELGVRNFWVINKGLGFNIYEPWIDDARSRGMKIIRSIPIGSTSVQEVYDFAKALVDHYGNKIDRYDLVNEVNDAYYTNPDEFNNPQVIAEKAKAVYDAVKPINPNARITMTQLGANGPASYIKEALQYGLANWTDGWGYGFLYHPNKFSDYHATISQYIGKKRTVEWVNEESLKAGHVINYQEQGMMQANEADPENIAQAKVIAWKNLINHHVGMLPNEWYKLYDFSYENYQLISDDFQTKYKGFYTIKYLNQYLNPRQYAPVYMGITTNPLGFLKFAFKASDTDVVLALWDANNAPTNSFDPGTIADVTILDYGLDPIQIVDPITGQAVDSAPSFTAKGGKVTIHNVEIVDYPRLVILGDRGRTPTEPYGQPGKPALASQ